MREERGEGGAVAPGARGADFSAMVKIQQDDRGWLWEYVRNPGCLSDGGCFGSVGSREEAVEIAIAVARRYLLADSASGVSDTRGVSPASSEFSSSDINQER